MKKPYELAELKITWFGKIDIVTASPTPQLPDSFEDTENGMGSADVDARKSPLQKLLR